MSAFELSTSAAVYSLVPGTSVQLNFTYDFSSSNGSSISTNSTTNITFQAEIVNVTALDTSSAEVNFHTKTITFTLTSEVFSGYGFGNYSCRFSLKSLPSDLRSVDIAVTYEKGGYFDADIGNCISFMFSIIGY